MKTISTDGIKFIKSFEGCRLTAYDDAQPKAQLNEFSEIRGTLTIGWGHTGNVKIGQTITQDQADDLFLNDLTRYINYVNDYNFVPFTNQLNQNQFDALVSFCYNCGPGNLKKLCANRTIDQISNALLKYNTSNGIVLKGLTNRRISEKQLFDNHISNSNKITIEELERELLILREAISPIPAPEWFINEFPNISDTIKDKKGTLDFWRSIAITLRILRK